MGNTQSRRRELRQRYLENKGYESVADYIDAQEGGEIQPDREAASDAEGRAVEKRPPSKRGRLQDQKDFVREELGSLAQSHWALGALARYGKRLRKAKLEREHEERRSAVLLEPNRALVFTQAVLSSFVFSRLYSSVVIIFGPLIAVFVAVSKAIYAALGWKYTTILMIDSTSKEVLKSGVVNVSIDARLWMILAPILSFFAWHKALSLYHKSRLRARLKDTIYLDELRQDYFVNKKIAKRLARAEEAELRQIEDENVEIL